MTVSKRFVGILVFSVSLLSTSVWAQPDASQPMGAPPAPVVTPLSPAPVAPMRTVTPPTSMDDPQTAPVTSAPAVRTPVAPNATGPMVPVAPPSAISPGASPVMRTAAPPRKFGAADWKGPDLSGNFDFGGMTGLGIVDSSGGFYLGATGAIKLLQDGFVPDITNPVFLEAELGPVFGLAAGAFSYALHLRWDFQKDSDWTLFALGGLAGDATGAGLGSHTEIFPSFGLGAFYRINDQLQLRGEVSHEQLAVGVNFTP